MCRFGLALVCVAVLGTSSGIAATLTVDLNGLGQFTAIQPAIDAAADGDTVLVKPGEYVITEPVTFKGKAITVNGEAGPEQTTIRMSETPTNPERASVVSFENMEGAGSKLEGFKLIGGKGTLDSTSGWSGGGVSCSGSSPTINNCTISGNSADGGGGVSCSGSSPRLTNCTISGNTAGWGGGGGLFCFRSAPDVINCIVSANRAWGFGGGVFSNYNSSPTLTNCTISGNSAGGKMGGGGGGVCCSDSSATILNCTISENTTGWGADGVAGLFCIRSSPTITNCTISGNKPPEGHAGGVSCWESSPILTNCIVWGNGGEAIETPDDSSVPVVTYSCIEGESLWPGEGNINSDPLFVQQGKWEDCAVAWQPGCVAHQWNPDTGEEIAWHRWIEGDYHLRPGSPYIDAGTFEGAPATDIEGKSRPCGIGVDIGAYEFGDCPPLPCGDPNADDDADGIRNGLEDVNGDGNCANDDTDGDGIPNFRDPDDDGDGVLTRNEDYDGNGDPTDDDRNGDGVPDYLDPNVRGPSVPFKRGDTNGDGAIDIADVIFMLTHLFAHGPAPSCKKAGNANDDGNLDIADAIAILSHLFAQTGPLKPPFGECGADLTTDGLDCAEYAPCN